MNQIKLLTPTPEPELRQVAAIQDLEIGFVVACSFESGKGLGFRAINGGQTYLWLAKNFQRDLRSNPT